MKGKQIYFSNIRSRNCPFIEVRVGLNYFDVRVETSSNLCSVYENLLRK